MSTVLDLNRRLATALGWSNIVDVGNALLGMPPWGIPEARGQAQVPNWAGCWKDCGPLMVEHLMALDLAQSFAMGHSVAGSASEGVRDHAGCRNSTARAAIVSAVIAKLEAAK